MTTATLGGVDLDASAAVEWAYTSGVHPFQVSMEVHQSRADSIFGLKGESDLVISRADGTTMKYESLSVMGEFPASRPQTRGLLVADRRWKWDRALVVGEYNRRRRTGDKRILDSKLQAANPVIVDEFEYASASLNNGRPWTAFELVVDVFRKVLKQIYGETADVDKMFDVVRMNAHTQLPIENVVFADQGDSAIERALAYCPGNDVYIDSKGVAIVYDTTDTVATLKAIPSSTRSVTGGTQTAFTTFERTRPSAIHVLYECEQEWLGVFSETTAASQTDNKEPREIHNVVPFPDVKGTIPADPNGRWSARDVAMGTWVTFEELFAYLAKDLATFFGDTLPAMSHDIVQQLFTSPLLQLTYVGANVAPDPIWDRRVRAILTHYRQTFRIAPKWVEKFRSVRSYRIAVLDTVTGTRAPAEVYTDYCVRPTLKRMSMSPGDAALFGWNVYALNDKGKGDLTKSFLRDLRAAQADMAILDEDQGIFRVEFRKSANLTDAQILPSAVQGIPSSDPSEQALTWEYARLAPNHRLMVLFTVSQAAPNGLGRLHEVVIKPEAASSVLGKPIGTCLGPPLRVRVGPAIMMARFAWPDDAPGTTRSAVDTAFGAGGGSPDRTGLATWLLNGDTLLALAKATAASFYSALLDRVEGAMTVSLDPKLEPVGSLSAVQHVLTVDGLPLTTIALPPNLQAVDMWSVTPEHVRRAVLGLVNVKT